MIRAPKNEAESQMGFSVPERAALKMVKGVGDTVIDRLEQIGFSSFDELANADASAVTLQISQMMRSTCWHNSPMAKAAVKGAIARAAMPLDDLQS